MFRTVHYKISSSNIPHSFDGFRIVHLSDLHGAFFGSGNYLLLQGIQKIKPDMIVMTGDMADNSSHAIERVTELCRKLCRKYPVYFAAGNHEQCLKGKGQETLIKSLKDMGIKVLYNSWETISRGGSYIKIYGLVTPMIYYKDRLREYKRGVSFTKKDAERFLGKTDASCYQILLAHNPLYFPSYRDWGADLTFSGNIHGGIIRIPGMGGLLSPDMTFFPKYDGGHFEEQGRHLVVSRGLGNHFLMRVMNPPELVAVTLGQRVRFARK